MPKQPVFTIFNHGTNASRDGTGEIVAEFGRLAAGAEYQNFLICDGPGSHPTTSVTPANLTLSHATKRQKRSSGTRRWGTRTSIQH